MVPCFDHAALLVTIKVGIEGSCEFSLLHLAVAAVLIDGTYNNGYIRASGVPVQPQEESRKS